MAKNKHATEQDSREPQAQPVRVDAEAYEITMQRLNHLQALLECMRGNNMDGFKSLNRSEQKDLLSLAATLAHEAQDGLKGGSF